MENENLKDAVRDAFRYHAPGLINIDRIIDFVEWAEKYKASSEEINLIIDRLLNERFIVKCNNGWQITSAAK